MANKYESSFTISVVGETTGEKWSGAFKVKTRFSHRDALIRDQLYRDFIGKQPGEPSKYVSQLATIFSELGVRIVGEPPSWWVSSNGGLDLEDLDVVVDIYSKAMEAEKAAKEELKGKAEKATEKLKKE